MKVVDWSQNRTVTMPQATSAESGSLPPVVPPVPVPVTPAKPWYRGLAISPVMQTTLTNWFPYAWPVILLIGYSVASSHGWSMGLVWQDVVDHIHPSVANRLGHNFREPLLRSLASAAQKAKAANDAGQPVATVQTTLQSEFQTQRDAAFQAMCKPTFDAANTPEKLDLLLDDFSRGLTRRW